MTEFVVTIAIMGTLLSMAVPKFTNVSEETQAERNLANMHTIREVFFHYFYRSMQRKGYVAHFPPAPTNAGGLMDDEWSRAAIDSSISLTSPNNLFYGKLHIKHCHSYMAAKSHFCFPSGWGN